MINAVTTSGDPEFYPKKHTVMNYSQQKRLATKRKNIKKHKTH